jgi:chemotaxis protein MotC
LRSKAGSLSLILMSLATLAVESAAAVEPVDMVRTLNQLQSKMSRGDEAARNATPKQIERIEQALLSVEPEAWKNEKNTRAAVIYLLSGGSPRGVRKLMDAGLFPQEHKALIAGSLAYAEGRSREAVKLLQSIDPKKLSPTLGGHLALVQGGLLIGSNNARASALFDLARLLMPGSLVEEAALRREISIVDAAHEPEKFLLLGRRYATQYSGSPFVKNFWDEVSAGTVRMALSVEDARLLEAEELFQAMNPAAKYEVYLTIARRAILNARIALAGSQTKKAAPLAQTPPARIRLKLYETIIAAISGEVEQGVAELQRIDSKSLSRADVELRDIVASTMKRLSEASDQDSAKSNNPPSPPKEEKDGAAAAESPIERSARQAIADADELLRRATKQ